MASSITRVLSEEVAVIMDSKKTDVSNLTSCCLHFPAGLAPASRSALQRLITGIPQLLFFIVLDDPNEVGATGERVPSAITATHF